MPTSVVLNSSKQLITFKLPTTYVDGTTPLPASAIIGIKITAGNVAGGPYTKTIMDTNLTPDPVTGLCTYPLGSLGMDLTKATYAVLLTELTGAESIASNEVGFQNLAPNPPSAVAVS